MRKLITMIALAAIVSTTTYSQKAKMLKINVATFNLRLDTPHDSLNAWSYRKEMVKSLIRFYDFDICGTQEGFKHQLDGIVELDNYAYTGSGRDDGKDAGEHSAIVYKKNRFKVLDSGNFWYSETPELPGKGWDATCCNRICSWAKFREINSGKVFFVFNSHYDHQGVVARRNSSMLLLNKLKSIAGNFPVFCTGDFNATPEQEPIQIIYKDGRLNDAFRVSKQPPYGTVGTFNAFNLNAPAKDRIDYIWTSKDIVVIKYGTLNDMQYSRFPSDHFPVVIVAEF